jgi:hypothetical protein
MYFDHLSLPRSRRMNTPVANPAEERIMGLALPIHPTEFEPPLHFDSSSLDPKDFISPLNQICVDNTPLGSLGDISRQTWVKPLDFVGVENAFCPSGYVRIFTFHIRWLVKLIMLHRTSNIMKPHTFPKTDAVLRPAFTVLKKLKKATTVQMAIILTGITRREARYRHCTKHGPLTPLTALKGRIRNLNVFRIRRLGWRMD